ncbi:MAG: hypothetical protein HOO86_14285, partial [Bacteroidales bacterium]|nr:hypothetical protein [Bacteroidales bacterium]
MKESTHREQILTKVRNALIEKTENPYTDIDLTSDVLQKLDESEGLEIIFANELLAVGGQFIYCENEKYFIDDLKTLMEQKGWSSIWCVSEKVSSVLTAGRIPHHSDVMEDSAGEVVGLTSCEQLIARTGSIVVTDTNSGSRSAYAYPDVHLV